MKRTAQIVSCTVHVLVKVGVVCAFILAFLLGGAVAWLSVSPVSLQQSLPYVNNWMSPLDIRIVAEEVNLSFKKRLRLELKNLLILDTSNTVLAKVDKGNFSFANRGILVGRIQPKHVQVDGLIFHATLENNQVSVGPLVVAQGQQEKEEKPAFDTVAFLNNLGREVPALKNFRTLRLKNTHILVQDKTHGVDWLFQDAAASLSRYEDEGERLALTGMIRQKQVATAMPVLVTAIHKPHEGAVEMAARFEQSNTDLVRAYIPEPLRNLMQFEGQIELGTRLGLYNKLEEPWFVLRLGRTEFQLEQAFAKPLVFDQLILRGRYQANVDVLEVQQLTFKTEQGLQARVQGSIGGLSTQNIAMDLKLHADEMELTQLIPLLPDQKLQKTTDWLQENLRGVQGRNVVATYQGQPKDFPFCQKACGLEINADVAAGDVRFFKDADWATNVKGTFQLKENWLEVKASQGRWPGQVLDNVRVRISGMFEPVDNYLEVEGQGQGNLAQLLDQLRRGLELKEVPAAQGQHRSTFKVALPLKRGDEKADISEVKMEISSNLTDVDVPLADLGNRHFTAPSMALKMKDTRLKIKGNGLLDGMPMDIAWSSRLDKPDSSAKIDFTGTFHTELLAPALVEKGVSHIAGHLPVQGVIHQQKDDVFTVDLQAQAKPLELQIPPLSVNKTKSQDWQIEAAAQVVLKGKVPELRLDAFSVTGEGVEIGGSVHISEDDQLTLQLNPLQLGEHRLSSLVLQEGELTVIGKQLDLRGVDLLSKEKQEMPEGLTVNVDVAQVLMKDKQNLQGLRIEGVRTDDTWQKLHMQGIAQDKPFRLNIMPEGGQRLLTVTAADVGAVLRTLGIKDKLKSGNLNVTLWLDPKEFLGSGEIYITKTRLVKVPILAKLLTLLSLEFLMESGEGVYFDSIKIPLKLEEGNVRIQYMELQGPSMDMRMDGYITHNHEINIDGKLVPDVMLNKTISRIPLVGSILAGSQDGVVVADFKIKGMLENPDISVKPLSVVTPGLLKDIWGGIFGK